jgi:phospholipid/cholesterol/gamma-HCH transport system substrate-binding protein
MPRTRSLAWAELKIGILTIVALVAAGLLVFAVGGEGGFFWQRYPLKARFTNIATVRAGTPVRLAGIEVGAVTEVRFAGDAVETWFDVSKNVRQLVTDGSTVTIGSISMLGEGALDITPAPGGTPIPDWGYVPSTVAPGSLTALTDSAATGLAETNRLLADIRAGKGTLGRLVTDDAAYREMEALMQAATRLTTAVERGRGSLGRLVNDPAVHNELASAAANLNAITTGIRAGEGSLGALIADPALARSITATTANLEDVSRRLAKGEGTAGKLLTDEALFARLTALSVRLDDLSVGLQSGRGTAGRLLQDDVLYDNMNASVAELRQLVSDIRKDPKKYLNVKVSLF